MAASLADTGVLLLNGGRQVGKSTLAEKLARQRGGRCLSLDDPVVAELASTDPSALVGGTAGFTVIDEVESAPALVPVLKREVDRHPVPGRFVLVGSADVFMLPAVADSLAGRMEVLTLEPLSQAEIERSPHTLIDALFGSAAWAPQQTSTDRADVVRRLVAGGFPEALGPTEPQRRDAWFRAYLSSLLQRDVRDYANIEGLHDMPRLLSVLRARTASLLNVAEVARATGTAHSTLRRYLSLLEGPFILQPLPAWSVHLGKRLVAAPKLHLIDAGLTAQLRGQEDPAALALSPRIDPLLETFVAQQLRGSCAGPTWRRRSGTFARCRAGSRLGARNARVVHRGHRGQGQCQPHAGRLRRTAGAGRRRRQGFRPRRGALHRRTACAVRGAPVGRAAGRAVGGWRRSRANAARNLASGEHSWRSCADGRP